MGISPKSDGFGFDHTPWEATDTQGYGPLNGVSVRDARGLVLAVAIGDVPELDSVGNARLIAAAPDLLAALRAYTDQYFPNPDSWPDEDAPSLRLAFAAIAKAEGRS